MARRKVEEENIRSLTKIAGGKSYSVTIPVDAVRRWRWKNRQKLQISIDEKNQRIIIEDWKK